MAQEGPQRRVESLLPHHPLEIGVLAAGLVQQGAVRARRPRIHGSPGHGEKGVLAGFETAAKDGASVGNRHRGAQRAGEPAHEPGALAEIAEGHPHAWALRAFRGRTSRAMVGDLERFQ